MKRYLCSVLSVLVLVLAACGPNNRQPNPTAGPIQYPLSNEGTIFGEKAVISTTKNCFMPGEPIIFDIVIQAGTAAFTLQEVQFSFEGRIYWKPEDLSYTFLPNGRSLTTTWMLPPMEEGVYTLVIEAFGSTIRTRLTIGIGYLMNPFTNIHVPCSELSLP